MRCLRLFLSLMLTVFSCDGAFGSKRKLSMVVSGVQENLTFICRHEHLPHASHESDVLFRYARWLQKNNTLNRSPEVDADVERLYRISAEHANYKANINLQNGAASGRFKLNADERLRLSEDLIAAKVATGYLFIAIFLEQGAAGLQADPVMALRYFRKAADSGSAQAQYVVAEKLAPVDMAPSVARQMRRCAAEQGHGDAAVALGVHLQNKGEYSEALEVLQMGVAGGSEHAAGYLDDGFRGPDSKNTLDYLGQQEDLERAKRYNIIWRILTRYSYADPVVPEINEILPLPPAKLPPWDGKLQWLEERLANVPPEKPSEALIHKLAQEKLLDPATGKPMPGSPAFSAANFPVMVCESDQPCPRTGYWKVMVDSLKETVRHFEQGEIMPRYKMTWTEPRIWPLQDKVVQREERVEWGLLG
ncbi:DUF6396 domain-containing protein [Pseudomonas sp. NPDC008258]|uniref:SEL1-like repeat protein n=1 Tax=Pseudomonas sp. NPDC008258 TaxID=3364418 RepID=UPI0036E8316D